VSDSCSRIAGFYKLDIAARRSKLAERSGVSPAELAAFDDGALGLSTADGMIENVIGTFALPMGVAPNFVINGVDYVVPMVIEEPSVVAAASYAARMVRDGGGFTAEVTRPVMIGQVQITGVADPDGAVRRITDPAAADQVLASARALSPRLCDRGGGPVGVRARVLSRPGDPDGGMVVAHVLVDCRDAMGANLVNTVAERVAPRIAELAKGDIGLRILSNLCDRRKVRVRGRAPAAALAFGGRSGEEVRDAIARASRFAERDPYRAATHNKGIMNGVDAAVLATGNDWRAVEAGAHAYAARSGTYGPLCTWRVSDDGALEGELEMPLALGIVGGSARVHLGARFGLEVTGARTAQELAMLVACVGMASNLAALRALATDGIQRGHMALHARSVAIAAGARGDEVEQVAATIHAAGTVSLEAARAVLADLRPPPSLPAAANE
jgi:hydroxymethylglutaryl-CoA reductase